MQDVNYVDRFGFEARKMKPLLVAVVVGLLVLLALLRIMPEESSPLTGKVMALLGPTLGAAGIGAYTGRRISGWLPIIGLFLLSVLGLFIIRAAGGGDVAVVLLLGWGFINGMILGPLVGQVLAEEGPQIIVQALTGTTAVMLIAGFVATVSGINFRFLMPILFLALMGLIIAGLVGIFVRFSRTGNLVYSVLGMIVFAGYFLYDFSRLNKSENTWRAAVQLTTSLYLDFANFFVYLLRFLLASRRR